jgi:hypothetical protein
MAQVIGLDIGLETDAGSCEIDEYSQINLQRLRFVV